MLKPEEKEGIIGFAAAAIVFWILTRTVLKKDDAPKAVKASDEDINIALDAYMMAVGDGAPEHVLEELNTESLKSYGIRIYLKDGGHFVVTDINGSAIRTV